MKSITRPVARKSRARATRAGTSTTSTAAAPRTGRPASEARATTATTSARWHLIALNSNCASVPCGAGSAQERWLRADLYANRNLCTLAYWHHPRFSSGHDGNNTSVQAIWTALYEGGVELALTGHSHNYERFAPMNAERQARHGRSACASSSWEPVARSSRASAAPSRTARYGRTTPSASSRSRCGPPSTPGSSPPRPGRASATPAAATVTTLPAGSLPRRHRNRRRRPILPRRS